MAVPILKDAKDPLPGAFLESSPSELAPMSFWTRGHSAVFGTGRAVAQVVQCVVSALGRSHPPIRNYLLAIEALLWEFYELACTKVNAHISYNMADVEECHCS
jgi:hypothetical protein